MNYGIRLSFIFACLPFLAAASARANASDEQPDYNGTEAIPTTDARWISEPLLYAAPFRVTAMTPPAQLALSATRQVASADTEPTPRHEATPTEAHTQTESAAPASASDHEAPKSGSAEGSGTSGAAHGESAHTEGSEKDAAKDAAKDPHQDAHHDTEAHGEAADAHGQAEHNAEAGEHGEHHSHAHHMALFLGATLASEGFYPSIGVDYAFRIPSGKRRLGLTAFVELTAAAELELLAGAGLEYHPIEPLKLVAIAGVLKPFAAEEAAAERIPQAKGPAAETATGSDAVSLVRLGIGYDFHVGRFSISPTLNGDYAHEAFAAVIGIGIGGGF